MTSSATTSIPQNTTAKSTLGFSSSVFRPNAKIPSHIYRNLIIIELIGMVGLWLLLPSIIPSPKEVLSALGTLIQDDGLIGELWTSLTLNLEAIGISTLIALALSYG